MGVRNDWVVVPVLFTAAATGSGGALEKIAVIIRCWNHVIYAERQETRPVPGTLDKSITNARLKCGQLFDPRIMLDNKGDNRGCGNLCGGGQRSLDTSLTIQAHMSPTITTITALLHPRVLPSPFCHLFRSHQLPPVPLTLQLLLL